MVKSPPARVPNLCHYCLLPPRFPGLAITPRHYRTPEAGVISRHRRRTRHSWRARHQQPIGKRPMPFAWCRYCSHRQKKESDVFFQTLLLSIPKEPVRYIHAEDPVRSVEEEPVFAPGAANNGSASIASEERHWSAIGV